MKHIFVINNPITDLIAKELIGSDSLKYKKDNVVILTYRNYKTNLDFKTISLPILKKKLLFFLTWIEVLKLNRLLKKLNDSFSVYLPTSGFEIFQIIISHSNCKAYNYLEEGLASYYSVEEKNKIHRNFIQRHSNFFLKNIREFYHFLNFLGIVPSYNDFFDVSDSKYKDSYCFSTHCFNGHHNKKFLNISFAKNSSLKEIKTVLVLESHVESGLLKKSTYLDSLEWLTHRLKEKGKDQIYFKLHPDQNRPKSSKKPILKLFNKLEMKLDVKFHKLNPSIKLEEIAYNSHESEFYVLVSSVAIYANICGRKTYSFYQKALSLSEDQTFKNYMETIPEEYFNITKTIDEN